ncbi:MAG: glycoside hydrolase family 31 protein [Clostridiales bacterium]|nr:glycoside hydrolase family 31 protein [Clostridiales bacterium]
MIIQSENKLIRKFDGETLTVEPWGDHAFRVRSSQMGCCENRDFALAEAHASAAVITIDEETAKIVNGKLTCEVLLSGKLIFRNQKGDILLEEYARNRRDVFAKDCSALEVEGREFKAHLGGDFSVTARFESEPNEKLFGMGQYQQPYLDVKGCKLELAHRNSQASVPFVLSSLGYGFLWNNPAIGEVSFGKNVTEWHAHSTKGLDYWITAGDEPSEITQSYTAVTGRPPMMPEYGLGFWQCKLRYRTQEELLEVAREHKRRNLPLDVIVVDFFHWPCQGDWKFDPIYFPDPEAMIRELDELGIKLMVSIWPTVDKRSENYEEMRARGLLVHTERGVTTTMEYLGNTVFFDATNPESREFVWGKAKQNYFDKGVTLFWLDEAEPEYSVYDFENYRYHMGTNAQIGNLYPVMYAKAFFDGMKNEGQENVVNLLRCAWAGSQKYGALVWSGDIASSFESMRNQLAAGLNMGIAGIPWWTTDIGGFHGGNIHDPAFHELLVRWFEWGTFCPVMRLHGDREPHVPMINPSNPLEQESGAANEVWSYGEDVYRICEKYLRLRETLRPYIRTQMEKTHQLGEPVMRPLFYDFPLDKASWEISDQYMFGSEYLIAPVMHKGVVSRHVYLPQGTDWVDAWSGERYAGGQTILAEAPLEKIPAFVRASKENILFQ